MPPLNNIRQETFCQEYMKDRDSFRSAKVAGYKCGTINSQAATGCQILKSINVKQRILELDGLARKTTEKAMVKTATARLIDQAWVVNTLVQNVDRSMQAQPVLDKFGRPIGVYTYEGGVANRGLELIGKNLGMFAEKSPLEGLFAGASVTVSVYLPKKHQSPLTVESNGHDNGPSHSND